MSLYLYCKSDKYTKSFIQTFYLTMKNKGILILKGIICIIYLFPQYSFCQHISRESGVSSSSEEGANKFEIEHHQSFDKAENGPFTVLEYPNNLYNYEYFLPDDFTSGTDSIFRKDSQIGDSLYLSQVVEIFNRKGDARVTEYSFEGIVTAKILFKGHGLDTLIKENYSFNDDGKRVKVKDTTIQYLSTPTGIEYHYYSDGSIFLERNWNIPHYDFTDNQTWYFKGGKIQGKNETDSLTGITTEFRWYKSGQMKEIGYHKNFKRTGIQKEFYENGQLASVSTYEKGFPIGKANEYYPNGKIKSEVTIEYKIDPRPYEDILEDEQKKYKEAQTENSSTYWDVEDAAFRKKYYSPSYQKRTYWNESGKKLVTLISKEGKKEKRKLFVSEAEIRDFFDPPEKRACKKKITLNFPKEASFPPRTYCIGDIEGIRTDTFAFSFKNNYLDTTIQEVTEIIEFHGPNGACHYSSYYSNGNKFLELQFKDSKFLAKSKRGGSSDNRPSEWGKCWYPNGNPKWEIKWVTIDDKNSNFPFRYEVVRIEYHSNGQKASEEFRDFSSGINKPIGIYQEWYPNGQLKEQSNYSEEGYLDGVSKIWSEDGTLLEHLFYEQNKKEGSQKYYDESGKLIKEEYYLNGVLQDSTDHNNP